MEQGNCAPAGDDVPRVGAAVFAHCSSICASHDPAPAVQHPTAELMQQLVGVRLRSYSKHVVRPYFTGMSKRVSTVIILLILVMLVMAIYGIVGIQRII
ncbi:hypothetical protein CN224_15715 [Sinorhizobium meliloti]|nr:hypothetical protein CN224_15715 [Sinorhizobium meliloti]